MAWIDALRGRAPSPDPEVPLFPLNTVLFPGGILPLKVFEQRYLDMAAACMKDGSPFGICLIARGQETGAAAEPETVGTLARIEHWEMPQLGILMITVRGSRRFRVRSRRVVDGQLVRAQIELLAEPAVPLPPARQPLLPLLRRVARDLGPERMPEPHRFDDAAWVGYRLTEILPVQNLAKQKLLELEDPLVRLEILERYLDQRDLLG